MGIKVEFNPDLCLRDISEYKNGNRKIEECIPENLVEGNEYEFMKSGQRLYWLEGELPLRETKGNERLSKPKASIVFTEVSHHFKNGQLFTRGKYKVVKILDDNKIYFDGLEKI